MDHATNHVADHQRSVLAFALDTLGLQQARPEAERALNELRLRQVVVALRTENQTLRTRLDALERQLYPGDADLDAVLRQNHVRLAGRASVPF
ncbi:MAG: hypothetical protein ACREKS_20510 [Candidatus Rokuibacteriota bacterium]